MKPFKYPMYLAIKSILILLVGLFIVAGLGEIGFRAYLYQKIVEQTDVYKSVGYTSGLVSGFVEALFDENGKTPIELERLIYKNSIENGTPEQLAMLPIASRGKNIESELFTPNNDIYFWWFAKNGKIKHESITHVNNKGLISERNYEIKKRPDTYRVVVLGDELTAATTANKSWPEYLNEANLIKNDKAKKTKVEVLNFAWPDAGYIEFKKVFDDNVKKYKPDLVVVNIAEHLFARAPNQDQRITSGPVYKTYWEAFKAPNGLRAWLIVTCHGQGRSLMDIDCDTGRPFGIWLSKQLAKDAEHLSNVQDQIVQAYVGAPIYSNSKSLLLSYLKGSKFDPISARAYKNEGPIENITPLSDQGKIALAQKVLRSIKTDHKNVKIIVNRNFNELLTGFELRGLLGELDKQSPDLEIINMTNHMPKTNKDEMKKWYQTEVAEEKWSAIGHKIYAEAVSKALDLK
jgi:hypothetical protein